MADQWHVTRDETKSGPFSSTALRRLAVSGKLLPSDQIWKEGMTKSVPASNLKGLFSDASSSAPSPSFTPNPSPPPQPISSPPPISSLPSVLNQHSGETAQPASPAPGHSFLERAKAGAADLAAKAKAAAQLASKQAEKTAQAAPTAAQSFAANMKATGQLVVKQAERTKIVQVTLTTAYFALGKSLYAAGNLRGEFPDAFKDVDDLLNATKAVDAQAAGRTTGDGLTAKAKAAGQAAMDMAQKKKLQVQSNYALSTLGKLAFEKLGEQCGSPDVIRPIIDAQSRLDTLDADITRLSESKSGGVTPKRLAIGGLAFVALMLLVGGLGFLSSGDSAFRQDSNGKSSKHREASSGAETSGDVDWSAKMDEERAAARAKYEPVFLQMLKEGDSAWDGGKKADAVQHYAQLLAQFCGHGQQDRTVVADLHQPEMARTAGRTIDFLADSGNDETAKDLIKKADQSRLVIVYSSQKVNRLVREAKVDQQREDKESEDWLERKDVSDGGTGRQERERPADSSAVVVNSTGRTWQAQLELLLKIRPGMTTYQVQQLLGVADDVNDDTDENDPSGALADRGETLTLLTWRGETNRDLIMIGFINDRLKDTSYIKVH